MGTQLVGSTESGSRYRLKLPEKTVLGIGHLAGQLFLHYCFVPFIGILLLPMDLNFRIKYGVLSSFPLFLLGYFKMLICFYRIFLYWNVYFQPVPLEYSFYLNLNKKMILCELEECIAVIFSSCFYSLLFKI